MGLESRRAGSGFSGLKNGPEGEARADVGFKRPGMKRLGRLTALFGMFLLLPGGGCVILEHLGLSRSRITFDHTKHSEKEELECSNCHTTFAKADPAGMPRRKVCILCHEGVDEEKPEDRKIAKLFPDPPLWSNVTAIPKEVVFSHKVHHDAKVACNECHLKIGECTDVSRAADLLRVDMGRCVECHARQPKFREKPADPAAATPISYTAPRASRTNLVAGTCAICHREIRKDRPPESHRLAWKKVHGQAVRRGGEVAADRCFLCHREDSCSSCHREEEPASHTVFWKDRGHGVTARMDRSTCAVCHQSDACDRCHRETAPRSHVGSWGSPRNRHCYYCHWGAGRQDQSCSMCHRSYAHNAPPRPSDPQHAGVPESQCRSCHSIIDMQHADNGDACVSCH